MPKCRDCKQMMPLNRFYLRKNGTPSNYRCRDCSSKRNRKLRGNDYGLGHIPKEALPKLKKVLVAEPRTATQTAYAMAQAWEVAQMQKGVPLHNFKPAWRQVMEIARKH